MSVQLMLDEGRDFRLRYSEGNFRLRVAIEFPHVDTDAFLDGFRFGLVHVILLFNNAKLSGFDSAKRFELPTLAFHWSIKSN